MKIYKVESNDVAFDEDEVMVINAASEARALEIAKRAWSFYQGRRHDDFTITIIDKIMEIKNCRFFACSFCLN